MYFNNFPTMLYDFETGSTSKKDYRIVLDITRNVRFRKAMFENITTYDYYDIGEGETPEIISEKIYGTPHYHWIIMLANQRYDYVNDFPLAQFELEARVDNVYGVGNRYNTHHFISNGAVTEATATMGIKIYTLFSPRCQTGDILQLNVTHPTNIAHGRTADAYSVRVNSVTQIGTIPSYKTLSVQCTMRSGSPIVGDVLYAFNGLYDKGLIARYFAVVTSFSLNSGYTPVSNYDYEDSVNESKRRIKIINPALVATVLKEFSALI